MNIGENIKYYRINGSIEEKTCLLRDCLASLKWELWEKQGVFLRKETRDLSKTEYAQMIINKRDYGYSLNDAVETRYNDRNNPEADEVFAFMKTIEPTMSNAFLFARQ